jgi:AAA15 family ATPase/GTPase
MTNINGAGEINNIPHQFKTLDIYLKDKNLKNDVEKFICKFDIGLNGFEIKKEDIGNKLISISVKGIHATNSENKKLDFTYESRGTQSLFFSLANILSALKNNNVVVIDEIEMGFHPEALNKLIGYFIEENENSHAQMIFSSHSLGFMNRLDMHQIFLVDKDKSGESSILRLNRVKGIRSDENLLGKYMAGSYGGFPKITV